MITSKLLQVIPKFLGIEVEDSDGFKKVFGNINWLTFENILRNIVSIFVLAWVARYLGPDQFGLMNYAYAFVIIFSSLSTLGLDNIVIKDLVENPEKRNAYLGSTFFLKVIGSILMLIITWIAVSIWDPTNSLLKIFVLVISFSYIFTSFNTIDFWFQSKVESKFAVYSRSIAFVVVSVAKIALIVFHAPLFAFVSTYVLEAVFVALSLVFFYERRSLGHVFEWKIDWNIIKNLFADSWPLMLGGIASLIYTKVDQVMIGKMLGDSDVGIYYSAVKLSEMWNFIPTVIGASVFPAILNARRKSSDLYKKRLQILFDSFTWFSILIGITVSIAAPLLITILYGPEYSAAAAIVPVHIWSIVFVFLGVIGSKWVIAENLTKNALLRTTMGAVLNVVLNIFLIRSLGVMGAAVSTLISYAFVNYLSMGLFKETVDCFLMQSKSFNLFRVLRDNPILKSIAGGLLHGIQRKYYIFILKKRNKHSKSIGITKNQREESIIISLTSYPKRFKNIYLTVESLLDQSFKPDKIVLWLSSIESKEEDLPQELLKLKSRGLTIKYVDENIRSFKKLIYSLEEYPNSTIVTVDDDTIYPSYFLKDLYKRYVATGKNCIVAYRCTSIEMIDDKEFAPYVTWKTSLGKDPSNNFFPTGAGGILYPPNSLDKEVLKKNVFMEICPTTDDIWFKAMGLLKGTKTVMVYEKSREFLTIEKHQEEALWHENVNRDENDRQIKAVFDKYNLYKYIER